MSIYKYIILALLALPLLASCNKEDDLTPSNADIFCKRLTTRAKRKQCVMIKV